MGGVLHVIHLLKSACEECKLSCFYKLNTCNIRNDALGEQHGAAVGGQDDAGQVVLSRGQEGKTLHVSGALMRVTFVNVYCINIGTANE